MLEARYIRERIDEVRARLGLRGHIVNLERFIEINGDRRKTIQAWEG